MRAFYLKDTNGGKNEVNPMEWSALPGFYSWSTHAEMKAIFNYLTISRQNRGRRRHHGKKPFRGKIPRTMYIVSYYKEKWRNSRPCDDCLILLRYYGVKKVIYTTGLTDPEKFWCCEYVETMDFLGRSSGNRRLVREEM